MLTKSVSPSGERTIDFVKHYYSNKFLWGDHMLVVFSSSFLCMKSNALKKSTNNRFASRFFAHAPSIIRQIFRIYNVVDRFLRNPLRFFWRVFPISDDKQNTINFSNYSSKSYASVVLNDSEVNFLGEKEDAAFCQFLYCVLFVWVFFFVKVVKFSCLLYFRS